MNHFLYKKIVSLLKELKTKKIEYIYILNTYHII